MFESTFLPPLCVGGYSSHPSCERGEGNVANVEVLPRPIPIANERKTAMKKLMVATGRTAFLKAGGEIASKNDEA